MRTALRDRRGRLRRKHDNHHRETVLFPTRKAAGRDATELSSEETETAGREEGWCALVCATKLSAGIIIVNYYKFGSGAEL